MRPDLRFAMMVFAALGTGACTSAPRPATGTGVDRVQVIGSLDPNDISYKAAGPSSSNATLEFPAGRVWSIVPSVYSVLSLPVSAVDSTNRFVVSTVNMRRSFRDQPVASLVDCGNSITGPNAANYTVHMKLTTQVETAAPEVARVRTIVEASGSGSGGQSVRCSSTGELERQILDRLRQGLTQ